MKSMRPFFGLAVGFVVVALLVIMVELLAFGGLTFTDPPLADRVLQQHAWVGGSGNRGERQFKLRHIHPLWGWGKPRTAVEPSADLRIFVTGGSTVWAWGNKSIPDYLEEILERRYPYKFDVINAGMPGWYSTNESAFLTQVVFPFFDADAVIVLDGYNDVAPALKGRLLNEQQGEDEKSIPSFGPPRDVVLRRHPNLQRSREFLGSFSKQPVSLLNQLLYASGISPYLKLNRTFTGVLVGRLTGNASLYPKSLSNLRYVRTFWRNYSPPSDVRQRAQARLGSLSNRQNPFDGFLTVRRRRHQLHAWIGGMSAAEWQSLLTRLRRMSPSRRSDFLDNRTSLFPFRWIERGRLPCHGRKPDLENYLTNVRSVLGSAQAHGVPVLYALQPAIVHKEHLVPSERIEFARGVTIHFFSVTKHHLPVGTCWHRVNSHFFGSAGQAFRSIQHPRSVGSKIVDLSRLFSSADEKRFRDFVHYTEKSHREIAEVLARHLDSMKIF